MQEENEFDYEGDNTFTIIQRYEEMLRENQSSFFDVEEFESIFDFYLSLDKTTEALEATNVAMRMHPYSNEIQIRAAEVLILEEKLDEAISLLLYLNKVEADNSNVHFMTGQAYLAMGAFNLANDFFNQALALQPSDGKYLMLSRIAMLYQDRDEYRIAISYWIQALQLDDYAIDTFFLIAYSYEKIGELDKSIQYYNEYIDRDPFASDMWHRLGLLHSQKGNLEEAAQAYDYAAAIDPQNSSALFNLAITLASLDRYLEAIEFFNDLLSLEPNDPKVHCSIGECYEKLGQFPKAHEAYKKALTINPAFAEAYYGIAVVMLESKNFEKALGLIHHAILLDETNYDFWLGLGKAQYELNKPDEAIDAYKRAVEINSEEPDAYLGIIEIMLYQQKYKEVESLYQEISHVFPSLHLLKVIHAAAQYYLGNPIEALATLKEAIRIEPNSSFDFLELVPTANRSFLSKIDEVF